MEGSRRDGTGRDGPGRVGLAFRLVFVFGAGLASRVRAGHLVFGHVLRICRFHA